MPRIAREKSSTGVYHVILRGINKQIIFQDKEDKERFVEILVRYKKRSQFSLYAYCIMDNHVHLLIKEGNEPLSSTMRRIGVSYVYWYNEKYERVGHLFQDRFKSEPVETDGYLFTVLRYIHQNPLKAGLVTSIDQYPWSSHLEYLIPRSNRIDTYFIVELFGKDRESAIHRYKEYMNQQVQEECLEIEYNKRLKDREAIEAIKNLLSIDSIEDIKNLRKQNRDMVLREIRRIQGLSIRQIARITGYDKNVISRAK